MNFRSVFLMILPLFHQKFSKIRIAVFLPAKNFFVFLYKFTKKVLRPEGFEPPTHGFEVRRSIQLSYGRLLWVSDGA